MSGVPGWDLFLPLPLALVRVSAYGQIFFTLSLGIGFSVAQRFATAGRGG